HALDAPSTAVQISHNAAGEFVGHSDLHRHDGLQQRGFGLLHGFLESDTAGHLEGEVVGIHFVIGAVVEDDFEVHHRIAGEIAARGRVLDSLFDGGNEVPGNGDAEDIVDEVELGVEWEVLPIYVDI